MLVAVIASKNYKEAIKDIKKAENSDLVELRLDYIKDLKEKKLKKIIKSCKKPIIATNRKKSECGLFNGNENRRIEILKNAAKLGVDYIDIEYSSDKNSIKNLIKSARNKVSWELKTDKIKDFVVQKISKRFSRNKKFLSNKKNSKIIVSYHNFKETPKNIKNIYNNIKKLNPDLIKIATNANSVVDNFKIFDLMKKSKKEKRKIIAFCMGSYGQFSRILSIIFGSQITYASIKEGKESAPGQPTIKELVDFYRIKKLNKKTKIVGLIGNPVEHSWSHIIHNAGFDKTGYNAVYLKFRVDKLKQFIEYFKKINNTLGFSVTIPHKIEVMKYLNEIDKKAKEIGAVNTILVKSDRNEVSGELKNQKFLSNKKLIGYNTDCDGAIQALKQKTQLRNKKVVLLGAGGSTRAIAYGLKEERAVITILNRTLEKARKLAEYFDCNHGSLDDLKNINYDILINTTSIGMYPNVNELLVPSNLIKKNSIVFDIVFNPFKTKLLKYAENKNCTIIPGFEMLIHGAMLQFKLWTGKNAPEHLMRAKVMNYLKNASN